MNLIERVTGALARAAEKTGRDVFHEPLVLGVSGGPDSLALLHLLQAIKPAGELVVGHLDHGLRKASATEAEIVSGMAVAQNLRFHTRRVEVSALAERRRMSIEEAARTARYDFLAGVAETAGAAVVVVGHNADDQVETILMHVLRGSGLGGLRGMDEAGPLPGHSELWLARPLLHITRDEIEAYCREHNLRPIRDESNADPAFLRNRLRHDLLPELETYNPQIRRRLRDMAEVIAADESMLAARTGDAWNTLAVARRAGTVSWRRSAWRALPLSIRRRVLRLALAEILDDEREMGFQMLESARRIAESGDTGSRADLPGGVALLVDYDRLVLTRRPEVVPDDLPQIPSAEAAVLPVPGTVILNDGWRVAAEIADSDLTAIKANADLWTAYIAVDTGLELTVRGRRPGEFIRPLGLEGQTKVKEIMIDRKIPAQARAHWPIVATKDRVVWIAGVALDDRARVKSESGRVVRLRLERDGDHEAG